VPSPLLATDHRNSQLITRPPSRIQRPYGGPDELRSSQAGTRMNSIDEHIQKDKAEIEAARAAGDQGKLRHLEEELKGLEAYKAQHPEDSHDPSPLEVFCDMNPEAPECRVYDD
jgi:hypothetical protein